MNHPFLPSGNVIGRPVWPPLSLHTSVKAERSMTQQTQAVSTQVDQLADQMLSRYQQEQREQQQRNAALQVQHEQQAIAVLQALIATEIEPELLSVLGITYVVRRNSSGVAHAEAVLAYGGITWSISQEEVRRSDMPWRWSIRAEKDEPHWYNREDTRLSRSAEPQTLRTVLLLQFGLRREQLRQEAEEAARKEEQRRRVREEAQAEKEREEHERAERLAQAKQEDAMWRAQLAARKREAEAAMWRWPEGAQVALYRLTYTSGKVYGDEGEPVIQQEQGWCASDHLDEAGYIRLEPVRRYTRSYASKPREVKLDPARHAPLWERIIVGSIEELPGELRTEVRVSLPNVVSCCDYDLDGAYRLREVEELGRDEDPYSEHVGYVPLPWIRALVEQAAQAES